MDVLVYDPHTQQELIEHRRSLGLDRFDEVWDGQYVVMPLPNIEHQKIVTRLTTILDSVLGLSGRAEVFGGVNVSDRVADWTYNHRGPDVAVVLADSEAVACGTHWCGGPDFLVEVVSPGDHTRERIDFYSKIDVREWLVVDRNPWALELYRHDGDALQLVARSTPEESAELGCEAIPFTWQLRAGEERPVIRVVCREDGREWLV